MRIGIVAASLLLSSAALAQSPPPRPPQQPDWPAIPDRLPTDGSLAKEWPSVPDPLPTDETPTPWACTLDKYLLGRQCALEASAKATLEPSAQARQNVAWATAAAARACASATLPSTGLRPEPQLQKACEKETAQEASYLCGLDGAAALQSPAGLLSTEARECAAALQEVLSRFRTQTLFGLDCCRCLAAQKCGPPLLECTAAVAEHNPDAQLLQCLQNKCGAQCAFARPPAARPEPQQQPQHRQFEEYPPPNQAQPPYYTPWYRPPEKS